MASPVSPSKKGYHEKLLTKMNKDFWNTSLVKPHSTFGASPKIRSAHKCDDGYAEVKKSTRWVAHDEHLVNHGRVRVLSSFGKPTYNPGAGYYDPKYEVQSKTETIAPELTMAPKRKDEFFDELSQKKKDIARLQELDAKYSVKKGKPPKQAKIVKGQYADVNIDDMRKSLLPGPGSYDGNHKMVERFERPSSAVMAPRQRIAKSRPVILQSTASVVDLPSRLPAADQYNIRDVGKKNIAYSIGEKRDLMGVSEIPSAGPGYYNTEQVMAIGGIQPLSSKDSLKKKQVQNFSELRACMADTSAHGRKGIKW